MSCGYDRGRLTERPGELAEPVRTVESLGIPSASFAQLGDLALALGQLADQLDVSRERTRPLVDRRWAGVSLARGQRADRAEQERIAQRAAADHDGVAAGLGAHAHVPRDIDHIAVADDGHVARHCVAHLTDDAEVALAGEALRARAAVDRDHRGAGLD